MAWGSKTTATGLTTITATEQYFTNEIDIPIHGYVDVKIKVNHGGTTDDAVVSFYGTLDDTTETWDGEPFLARTLLQSTSDNVWVAFRISGFYRFRVGVKSTGSTDSHAADMAYRVATP